MSWTSTRLRKRGNLCHLILDQELLTKKSVSNWDSRAGFDLPTLWIGMGVEQPPYAKNQVIITFYCFLIIIAVFLKPVMCINGRSPCRINSCYERYLEANAALQKMYISRDDNGGQKHYDCVAIRTYARCIKDVSRGCHGDIRYHSLAKILTTHLERSNCSREGQVYESKGSRRSTPSYNYDNNECQIFPARSHRRNCILFGDPHLKTFNNLFQTCRVHGTWPLVNNDYFVIQVTSEGLGAEQIASAVTKLSVIIRSHKLCGHSNFVTYMAKSNNVPSTFYGGQSYYGQRRSIEIIELSENRHVEIHIRYISTVIAIRQLGVHLFISVSLPDSFIEDRTNMASRPSRILQLCIDGCPSHEVIDHRGFLSMAGSRQLSLRKGGMRRVDAAVLCREAGVTDFYFDSCVFDLITTDDRNFTSSAAIAYNETMSHDPSLLSRRQDFSLYDHESFRRHSTLNDLHTNSEHPRSSTDSIYCCSCSYITFILIATLVCIREILTFS